MSKPTHSGFTLTEVLVAIAVVTVVMTLVFRLIIATGNASHDLQARVELQSQAASLLDRIAEDFQSAKEVIIENSGKPAHPDFRIVRTDRSKIEYRWDEDIRTYFRKRDDEEQKKFSPDDSFIENVCITETDGLAQIALTVSRRVRGTARVVRTELSTQVQTAK